MASHAVPAENSAVVHKLLAEEHPLVTTTVVNQLCDDAACALLISKITRLAGNDSDDNDLVLDGPRDSLSAAPGGILEVPERDTHEVTPGLLNSYRATMLLTGEDSADALMPFMAKKSKLVTKCIFPIFQKNSQGNLRHGCRVIDHLLRYYMDDVYDVIGRNAATVKRYMSCMLNHIEQAPVAEVFLSLICKPHNAALLRYYGCTPSKKWTFFRSLSEWKLLLVLSTHITGSQHSELHSIGAADVFLELLDRLSADENGELLLQPAAYCPELLESLIDAAVDSSAHRTNSQRLAAMKCVFRLLQKSTLEKVQGPPTSPYQSFGGTIVNLVPNQLAPLRERIYELVEKHMGKLLRYLVDRYEYQQNIEMDLASDRPLPDTAVRHTAYVVKVPFTEFRLTLVEALVEIVAHNPSKMGEYFDVTVWRVLVSWFFEYAHTNLYHAAFYQLVFIALRTDNQLALEVLVKKLKLITSLVEHYRQTDTSTSNKGYIMQCCNAIRLQAASQSPDAFLRNFLQSHTTWRNFEPELRAETNRLCVHGLGFNVPQAMRGGYASESWQTVMDETEGIDHGSEYARSLGFLDDVAWPEDDASDSHKKKKKKKKGGKKKAGNGGGDESSGVSSNGGDDSEADSADEMMPSSSDDDESLLLQLNGHHGLGDTDIRNGASKPKKHKKKHKKK